MVKHLSLPGELTELYSPIGLLPVDALTGDAPMGKVSAFLDLQDDNGNWRDTGIKEVRTPGGVIAYPGLERRGDVIGKPPRHYRVRIEAELYQPLYLMSEDAIEFDAFPYNDNTPPANYPKNPDEFPDYLATVLMKVMLTPVPNYPFPTHMMVLRGVVIDKATGEPVDRVEVVWDNKEVTLTSGDHKRVLTATKGVFALPLRVTKKDQLENNQLIDAFDHRTNRTGQIEISIPQAVGKNQIIPIE